MKPQVRERLTGRKLTYLLAAMLVLFLGSACQTSQSLPWFKLFLALILTAGLAAVTTRERWRAGTLLAAPALVASGLNGLTLLHSRPLVLVEGSFATLFLAYAVWVILGYVLAQSEVTLDSINGALCAYLLLGLIWTIGYATIESLAPGSFVETVKGASRGDLAPTEHMFSFAYYSFMTLTSVGHGDILPVAAAARTLTVLEALVGQIYLVVLVARLVGTHIAQHVGVWQSG
jgi:hypothetical protein